MKRKVLGCIALLCSSLTWADNVFSIDDFTINAGEEKVIAVKMYHDVDITAFQFELFLPEGVSIKTKKSGKLTVTATDRLSPRNEDDEVVLHNLSSNIQTSGGYRIMAYSNESLNVAGDSGDPVVTITIVASDQISTISTGAFTPQITNMEMTEANGAKHKINPTTYNCTVTLETTVTSLGYASFSWPKALDFTNTGLTAYIATSTTGNSLHLESVTKVPANTGLILKGAAGSYPLQTTEETTDDVSANMLASNTTGTYTVETDNVYVLSNRDGGKPGFYPASQGLHVGQYKSYLVLSSGSRQGLVFDEGTTGINGDAIQEQPADNHIYNLNGQRLQTSTVGSGKQVTLPQKGIYIMNGKKYIVK